MSFHWSENIKISIVTLREFCFQSEDVWVGTSSASWDQYFKITTKTLRTYVPIIGFDA